MKILHIILGLTLWFPLIVKSEYNVSTEQAENIISTSVLTNTLTPQEKTDLISTIKLAMRILVDNTLLEEQKESVFFDGFNFSYPKHGPINRASLVKKNLLAVGFFNDAKDKIIWTRGSVTFDHKRYNTDELRTLFTPDDFDKLLDLTFEKANKETVEYKGKEVGSYYLYTYHWKLNNKLKVMFRVQDNFYIKENNYPRDFYMIEMVLDN